MVNHFYDIVEGNPMIAAVKDEKGAGKKLQDGRNQSDFCVIR